MERARVVVRGLVQGVGFRPFIYRLATELGMKGWVLNSTEGVVVEAEGAEVGRFVAAIKERRPPLARIDRLEVNLLPVVGYASFAIEPSTESAGAVAQVSPDVATCDDCLREIHDPLDRRHNYPFTNCTNCGPRFTIVKDIPYDRPKTTMAAFAMCSHCRQEYENPLDRRFHAQPNACPDCGPRLSLLADGQETHAGEALESARRLLRAGKVVAVKGLGGFHLACDATDEGAVSELRRRKLRVEKPFAIMVPDVEAVERICHLDDDERRLLESPPRPVVLLRRAPGAGVADSVAPSNRNLGVMLPYTPLHHLLLRDDMPPLVMTSGNMSEEPIVTGNEQAVERLGPLADAILLHDRDIHIRCDDSVTRVFRHQETVVRRSRGYAPFPIRLSRPATVPILACGAELKNTFCLVRDDHAFLSQHIGDLENTETLRSFEDGIAHFERLFHVRPEALAYDLHPDYLATRYALARGAREAIPRERQIGVQHHHAHVASCLAENGVEGPVIGVALDGTGYGLDGAVWGGEFLVGQADKLTRAGHLAYVPLPGGDAAVRRPYRTALSYVHAATGEIEPALHRLRHHLEGETGSNGDQVTRPLDGEEVSVLARQVRGALNSPATSSVGRLFDAVSALAGVRQVVNYEGQAAIHLEMVADLAERGAYPLPLVPGDGLFQLDSASLIRSVWADIVAGVPASTISARFHRGLAQSMLEASTYLRDRFSLSRVALSGGVFQNQLLLGLAIDALEGAGFQVFIHHQVPCNDGGIALGQAAIARARLGG